MLSSDTTVDTVIDGLQLESSPKTTATLSQLIRVIRISSLSHMEHDHNPQSQPYVRMTEGAPDLVSEMCNPGNEDSDDSEKCMVIQTCSKYYLYNLFQFILDELL